LDGNGARAVIIAVAAAMVAGACGGIVVNESQPDGSVSPVGGNTGAGESPASGGRASGSGGKTGAQAGSVAKGGTGAGPAVCGNGRVDPGEECDPSVAPTLTCATATMGAKPVGLLRCTKACRFDTSSCSSGAGGATGTGGKTGTAGKTGTGGAIGSGGQTASFDVCLKTSSILTNDCTQTCGCKVCPDVYAACKADGGCSWILACAHQAGCVSIDDCYQTSCSGIIDQAGGRNSVGAKRATPALACLADNGCGVACP
jgi:hypothetical protein